jgi:uncharacterized protein (DUF2235 family)
LPLCRLSVGQPSSGTGMPVTTAEIPKNIAVFLDGTRNRLHRDNATNVAKLFEATTNLDEPKRSQVSRYLHGVGTRPSLFEHWTRRDP